MYRNIFKMYNIFFISLALCLASTDSQRVAPGVPPQHYQQPPQQYQQYPQQQQQYAVHTQQNLPPGVSSQQYQQEQMHQQQQMQYQQVPVHQQVPVQQVPQIHSDGHHAPHSHNGQQQVLNAANAQHERQHIQEHMQVPIDTSKMSEAELQFHYFKMHDSDNNNKLDGCELIKSLIHWHEGQGQKGENNETATEKIGTVYTDEQLDTMIQYVLDLMDLNKDGYIDYSEYRKSEEASDKGNKP